MGGLSEHQVVGRRSESGIHFGGFVEDGSESREIQLEKDCLRPSDWREKGGDDVGVIQFIYLPCALRHLLVCKS